MNEEERTSSKGERARRVKSPSLPLRTLKARAQRDLDQYAARHGLVRCCRECGCTDEWGCDEGCYWVLPGLCSSHSAESAPSADRSPGVNRRSR